MKHLNGFDYVTFLKRHLMVGQIDPWRRTEDGKPFYCLLVPVDTAIAECSGWSNQEIHRTEFLNYLKLNDVLSVRNIDEFMKVKETIKNYRETEETPLKLKRKPISEERRKKLQEQAKKMNELKQSSKKASIS